MKSNLKLYEEFDINEGGNALSEYVRRVTQAEIPGTLKFIEKGVFPLIGLNGFDDDAAVIGSAGKKSADETSGDIDIAVSIDKIAGFANIPMKKVLDFIEEKLQKAGFVVYKQPGFQQVSVAVPIDGIKTKGYAQVDLMLSESLEWSRFMYHSPDFRIAESRYKGAYRNMLIMAIASESEKIATKTLDTGEVAEYAQLVIRLDQGLVQVRKSLEGKKGLVKTPKVLHEYDKVVSNVPENVTKALFGEKIKPSDISTFEKAWQVFNSSGFPYASKKDDIVKKLMMYLSQAKLPVPEEVAKQFAHLV